MTQTAWSVATIPEPPLAMVATIALVAGSIRETSPAPAASSQDTQTDPAPYATDLACPPIWMVVAVAPSVDQSGRGASAAAVAASGVALAQAAVTVCCSAPEVEEGVGVALGPAPGIVSRWPPLSRKTSARNAPSTAK